MTRIDTEHWTKRQLGLVVPMIQEYIDRNYCHETGVYQGDGDYWETFIDPETNLEYDMNLWVDDIEGHLTVNLYNVEFNSVDTTTEQFVWGSCDWSLDDWITNEYRRIGEGE